MIYEYVSTYIINKTRTIKDFAARHSPFTLDFIQSKKVAKTLTWSTWSKVADQWSIKLILKSKQKQTKANKNKQRTYKQTDKIKQKQANKQVRHTGNNFNQKHIFCSSDICYCISYLYFANKDSLKHNLALLYSFSWLLTLFANGLMERCSSELNVLFFFHFDKIIRACLSSVAFTKFPLWTITLLK